MANAVGAPGYVEVAQSQLDRDLGNNRIAEETIVAIRETNAEIRAMREEDGETRRVEIVNQQDERKEPAAKALSR